MKKRKEEKKAVGNKTMKKKLLKTALVCMLGAGMALGGCGSGNKTESSDRMIDDSSMNGVGSSYEQMHEGNEKSWESFEEGAGTSEELETEVTADAALPETEGSSIQDQKEKLIYTYRYSVETKAFDDFLVDIREKTEELGGYVENSETNGSAVDGNSRYASITLRIPADKTDQMLAMVKEASNVVYDNVSSENVTLRYVDMESHIKALRTEQKTLLRLIEKADKIEDIIALQSQLTQVRYEIESYESQLRAMDNLVEYSTMYLDITEVERTTTANKKVSFGEEIKNRFSDNLYALGQWMRSFVIGFIGSLPILLPLILAFLAAVYILRRWGKRRSRCRQQQERTVPGSYRSIYQNRKGAQKADPPQQQEDVQQQDMQQQDSDDEKKTDA